MQFKQFLLRFFSSAVVFLLPVIGTSQTSISVKSVSQKYIKSHLNEWKLKPEDVKDLSNEQYTDQYNGVTHIYYNQRYNGYKIYGAITSVHVTKDGKAYSVGNRFIDNIKEKVNTTSARITADDALSSACKFLRIPNSRYIEKDEISDSEVIFKHPEFAFNDIKATLMYQPTSNHELRLVWNMAIDNKKNSDYQNLRIDAVTGEVIDHNNYTLYCKANSNNFIKRHACIDKKVGEHASIPTPFVSSTYRVVKYPNESPIYGLPELVVDPASPTASPYGWHDVDGSEGAEFTITKGNNVNAYLDENDKDSGGFQPDGGESLNFDFAFDETAEPEDQKSAAITNLFYANNFMHDFSYDYGFTQAAGNFQENNYGVTGGPNDGVVAQAQDGSKANPVKINNANFATPPDGNKPRMQMYIWTQTKVLEVLAPDIVAGIYQTGTATYGPDIIRDNIDITGEVAIYKDNIPNLKDGCQKAKNPEELNGKIALIDRGSCYFEDKTDNAEDAGAIAVIICNFADELPGMAGRPNDDSDPTIPTVSMGKSTCDKLKLLVDKGLKIRIHVPSEVSPKFFDGDFDNGVMAHEYAHGISNRLTGGPGFAGGLGNKEQMGEGWSDFFSLVTTTEVGDSGTDSRGVGNYLNGEGINGNGIRRHPYSTDMSINPLTYADVAGNTEIHALGEVWTAMLWDLYWAFVDEYGFNADRTDKTAGNNMAIQLVMDGMKMQPTSPGFIDGRDAILLADQVDFNNEHNCLIWKVFARRGLGIEADQGLSDDAGDQVESFLHKPECVKELKISKSFPSEILPGDEIEYTLHVINHMDSVATNIELTDEIPDGCSYVEGSASETPIVNNGIISWNLPDLAFGEEVTITYKVVTDASKKSSTNYYEGFEGDQDEIDNNWSSVSDGKTQDGNVWELLSNEDVPAKTGEYSFFVVSTQKEHDESLLDLDEQTIQGEHPHLVFSHNYDTEGGADAGLLYISKDEGDNWIDLGPYMTKNGYTGAVQYATFVLPFLKGFSGNSNGYITTYVDLSSFIGEKVIFKWRYGSDDNIAKNGWGIDDIILSDLVKYKGEACVNSDQTDKICTSGDAFGTAVLPALILGSKDLSKASNLSIDVYPNPASDNLIVNIPSNQSKKTRISLISVDGRIIREYSKNNESIMNLNIKNVPSGFYIVKVQTDFGTGTQKVIIK